MARTYNNKLIRAIQVLTTFLISLLSVVDLLGRHQLNPSLTACPSQRFVVVPVLLIPKFYSHPVLLPVAPIRNISPNALWSSAL